ncbi:T9SS type A sorting domain-containing protein, partial [Flavobacteriales bacterium]|nr:T9SS type A sorting domain-containing protein [Flavobacteriales bacterium]
NVNDGSCITACVYGCTDANASNYNSSATCDDGSCIAPPANCSVIARPTGVHATGITDTKFRLNWDNMNTSSCMVLAYNVRTRLLGSSGPGSWTTRSAGLGNGLCNFGLQNTDKLMGANDVIYVAGETYEVRMRAQYCGSTQWSAWTPSVLVTMADPCPELTNVAVQTFNGQPNKAKFTWDSTGTYLFARVYARLDQNAYDSVGNVIPLAPWVIYGGFGIDSPTLHHNEFTFTPGEYYRVQMAAFCSYTMTSYKSGLTPPVLWNQPPSNTPKVEGGTAIGNLDVYPNPSRDIFNVTFTSDDIQDLGVRIINIVGEVIYTEDLEQFVGEYTKQVDLATYTKGVYFLEITTNNGVVNKKLILQ